jgi:hypothetical protein
MVMRETRITLPELILVAGTRAAFGLGLGLLLADRLSRDQRRGAGWTLCLIGALSTVPLTFEIFGGHRLSAPAGSAGLPDGRRTEANESLSQQRAFAGT